MLVISGLYHANPKTQMVDPSHRLRLILSMRWPDLPYFDIDKNNFTRDVDCHGHRYKVGETRMRSPQKLSMRLKLKTPNPPQNPTRGNHEEVEISFPI